MTDYLGELEDLVKSEYTKLTQKPAAPEPVVPPVAQTAPVVVGTILQPNSWPLQTQCNEFYGNAAASNWLHDNTEYVKCPWTLYMGKVVVPSILIHKKVAPSLTRVLNYIWEQVGKSQDAIEKLRYDQYDGSYNFRPIRGGSILSMHSYAVAIDFDAADNEQHSQKHLFTDDSLLVKAFKQESWIWGGDWSPGSIDAMHVQAARVH